MRSLYILDKLTRAKRGIINKQVTNRQTDTKSLYLLDKLKKAIEVYSSNGRQTDT